MRITLKQDTFETWSGHDDGLDATNGLQIELDSNGRVILVEVERCGTYREMAISLDALLPALQALASTRDEEPATNESIERACHAFGMTLCEQFSLESGDMSPLDGLELDAIARRFIDGNR